jgi:hydrocephalus-inducing protein
MCTAPKPQGPYTVRAKSSIPVPFKNIFLSAVEFKLMIDNPLFTVKPTETIKSKKAGL